MNCPICGKPYSRGLNEHTGGETSCLSRVLSFIGMEFPGFVFVGKLDDGSPIVLVDQDANATEAVDYLQQFIAAQTAEPSTT